MKRTVGRTGGIRACKAAVAAASNRTDTRIVDVFAQPKLLQRPRERINT